MTPNVFVSRWLTTKSLFSKGAIPRHVHESEDEVMRKVYEQKIYDDCEWAPDSVDLDSVYRCNSASVTYYDAAKKAEVNATTFRFHNGDSCISAIEHSEADKLLRMREKFSGPFSAFNPS